MSDIYTVLTPPASTPISWEEVKEFGRGIPSLDQSSVEQMILAATDQAEKLTSRVFVEREIEGRFSGFCYGYEPYPYVVIRRSPLISISEVEINGDVLAAGDYKVKDLSSFSRVWFINTPTLNDDPYPVKITFTAGYPDIPDDIKNCLMSITLFKYENRGDMTADMAQSLPTEAAKILRDGYKIVDTF